MPFSTQLVEIYLRDRVAPVANRLDHSSEALHQAFLALGQQGWLGLKIPAAWNGSEIPAIAFQQFQELVARHSGALAFLQAQHQSAGSFLSRSENTSLKQQYLPFMGTGEIAVGVGFSHLRRPSPPLQAMPVTGGFVLEGTIPWITGFGIFSAFVGAAVLPDKRAVYGILPFTNNANAEGKIQFSKVMPLAAMTASNTVTAELHQWFLPSDQVLMLTAADAIQHSDRQNVLQHSFFALGCASAGLDLLEQIGQARSLDWVQAAYHTMNQSFHQCRDAIYAAHERSFEAQLQLRATAIELAVRCAHAAVVVSAGAANSLHHPAQRIYREAMMFSVTGQTAAVMKVTLQHLAHSGNVEKKT